MTVAIINNGGANMNSLIYALKRLNLDPLLTDNADEIAKASHVILPGVGHATDSMARLKSQRTDQLISTLTQPVLGICLGMQLMYDYSEEGNTNCLSVIDGKVRKMDGSIDRPAPHMGWNQIDVKNDHDVFNDIADGSYFYFVHGYTADVNEYTIASSDYGYPFTAVAARDNFIGVQFHPERSGPVGAQLLRNFVALT
ncbi:MAG: imidazole glycerol phosphate synthase subunit HisH [Gammaproteobacteria bacterium]